MLQSNATHVAQTRPIPTATLATAAIAILFFVAAPFVVYPVFLMKVMLFALFATSFSFLLGYVGLLSFGHAAFFGAAAYVSARAAKVWGLTPELAIVLGVFAAGGLGAGIGYIAIRRQGIYFAMITLALAQLVYFSALRAPFTGGEDGIQGVPRGRVLGMLDLSHNTTLYYFVAVLCFGGCFVLWRAVHSPFGQVLKAIRDNEPRAISLGYDVRRFKLGAFVLSAAIAGLAGATKPIVFQLASLTDVQWQTSGEVLLMTLIGGVGTTLGPIVGAALIVTLQNYLAETALPITMIMGLIFIVCVLAFRRGIVGEIEARLFETKPKGKNT